MKDSAESLALAQQIKHRLENTEGQLLSFLGLEIESITPGNAVVRLLVKSEMCHGLKICQGGFIFLLADAAMAYACMSGNRGGVTLSANVVYNKPAREGDTLLASAVVSSEGGRTGTCHVTVVNQDAVVIAHFQGVNYYINKPVLSPSP